MTYAGWTLRVIRPPAAKAETVAELISRAANAPDRKYVIRFMGVPPIHFDEFSIKAKLHKRKGTATYTVSSV